MFNTTWMIVPQNREHGSYPESKTRPRNLHQVTHKTYFRRYKMALFERHFVSVPSNRQFLD